MRARPAIESDEAAVLAMAEEGTPEVFPHLTYSERVARESFRRAIAAQIPAYTIVETEAGEPAGFQVVAWGNSDFSETLVVEQRVIYVRPQFRGSDAAGVLLRDLLRWSSRLGARELYVNVGSGYRHRATARFVRRFGFQEIGSVLRKVSGQ